MSQLQHRPLRKTEILSHDVHEEVIVYDLALGHAHSLEPSLASLWKLCDGETTVEQIAERLGTSVDVVGLGLRRLDRAELLETPKVPWKLSGSRRDLLTACSRLGGLAVVSALLPTPAAAATKVNCGGACTQLNCNSKAHTQGGFICTSLPICCCNYYITYPKKGGGKVTRFARCTENSRCGASSPTAGGSKVFKAKCL